MTYANFWAVEPPWLATLYIELSLYEWCVWWRVTGRLQGILIGFVCFPLVSGTKPLSLTCTEPLSPPGRPFVGRSGHTHINHSASHRRGVTEPGHVTSQAMITAHNQPLHADKAYLFVLVTRSYLHLKHDLISFMIKPCSSCLYRLFKYIFLHVILYFV